jgi:hypothetical protein
VGVAPSDRGWKGVAVGVASAGAVTRKRAVGEAVVGLTGGAAQPAKITNISSAVRKVLLMDFWSGVTYFQEDICFRQE